MNCSGALWKHSSERVLLRGQMRYWYPPPLCTRNPSVSVPSQKGGRVEQHSRGGAYWFAWMAHATVTWEPTLQTSALDLGKGGSSLPLVPSLACMLLS